MGGSSSPGWATKAASPALRKIMGCEVAGHLLHSACGWKSPPPVSPTPIACVYLTQHSLLIGKWRHKNQSDLPKNGFQEPSRQLISERGVGRGSAGRQVTGAAWEGQRREDLPVQTPWSGRRY